MFGLKLNKMGGAATNVPTKMTVKKDRYSRDICNFSICPYSRPHKHIKSFSPILFYLKTMRVWNSLAQTMQEMPQNDEIQKIWKKN